MFTPNFRILCLPLCLKIENNEKKSLLVFFRGSPLLITNNKHGPNKFVDCHKWWAWVKCAIGPRIWNMILFRFQLPKCTSISLNILIVWWMWSLNHLRTWVNLPTWHADCMMTWHQSHICSLPTLSPHLLTPLGLVIHVVTTMHDILLSSYLSILFAIKCRKLLVDRFLFQWRIFWISYEYPVSMDKTLLHNSSSPPPLSPSVCCKPLVMLITRTSGENGGDYHCRFTDYHRQFIARTSGDNLSLPLVCVTNRRWWLTHFHRRFVLWTGGENWKHLGP